MNSACRVICRLVAFGLVVLVIQAAQDAEPQFAKAQELFMHGDAAQALAAVRNGLQLAPGSVKGLNLLGMIYARGGRFQDAEAAFHQALRIDPSSTATHNNLGNSYLAAGKPDLAEHEFQASLRTHPSDPGAHYALATLLLDKGDGRRAVPHLEAIHPADMTVSIALVRAYLEADQPVKAIALAQALSRQGKDDVRVHFSLGVALAQGKRYDKAAEELAKADVLAPNTFEILYNLGEARLRAGQFPDAAAALEQALKLQPDSARTICLLAESAIERHRFGEALDLLSSARKSEPGNPTVLFLMAQINMKFGLFTNAVSLLEEGQRTAPARPELIAALGEAYFGSGETDRALDQFQKLIKVSPGSASYTFMGIACERLGRFDDAVRFLNHALAQDKRNDKRNAACLYTLGIIAARRDERVLARKYLADAVRVSPDFDHALYELGSLKIKDGEYSEALPLLRRCVELNPSSARAYYRLSLAERKLNLEDAAAQDLKRFQALSKQGGGDRQRAQQVFAAFHYDSRAPKEASPSSDVSLAQDAHPAQPVDAQTLFLSLAEDLSANRTQRVRNDLALLDGLTDDGPRPRLVAGKLLLEHGSYQDAIRELKKALDADPSSDDARIELARAYLGSGDFAQALDVATPASPKLKQRDDYSVLIASLLARNQQFPEAINRLQNLTTRNPNNDGYLLLFALVRLRAGDPDGASAAIADGLRKNPGSGLLLWGRGVIEAATSGGDAAEADLQAGLDMLPDWRSGCAVLAMFYAETGQNSRARETLARYRSLSDESDSIHDEVEARLKTTGNGGSATISPEGRKRIAEIALNAAGRLYYSY